MTQTLAQEIGLSSRGLQFRYSTAQYQERIVMCNIHLEETEGQFLQDVEQKKLELCLMVTKVNQMSNHDLILLDEIYMKRYIV